MEQIQLINKEPQQETKCQDIIIEEVQIQEENSSANAIVNETIIESVKLEETKQEVSPKEILKTEAHNPEEPIIKNVAMKKKLNVKAKVFNRTVAKVEQRPVAVIEERPWAKVEERLNNLWEEKPIALLEERPIIKAEERQTPKNEKESALPLSKLLSSNKNRKVFIPKGVSVTQSEKNIVPAELDENQKFQIIPLDIEVGDVMENDPKLNLNNEDDSQLKIAEQK